MARRPPRPELRPRGIIGYFAAHPTVANLSMVLMMAFGLWAAPQMRAQFFPDTVVEEMTVTTRWDGAGPEDVDRAIVEVLEPALMAVDGVAGSSALSREGVAAISLEFEPGWDMARAAGEAQAAVDAVTGLPEGADKPEVARVAWRDRVTDVVITGPVAVDQLARLADEFVARLYRAGITRATIQGLAAPSVVVEVPSINLIRHQVELSQIAQAIGAEASADPAGEVSGANARLRTGAARRSAEEVAAVVVRSNPDGSTLTVGDLGRVRSEGADRGRAYFVGDNPAITVRVDRSDRGDAISMQATVQRTADQMSANLPRGVRIDLVRTRAEAITGRLNILLDNGLMGLGLVVALLFLFLNARTAFWVAAGIPVAMATAVGLMYALGMTLNMVSIFALIITLGIVVDDAIVVGEHADHLARAGQPPLAAAVGAARRMAAPVLASTVTTVIAFLGLVTIGGTFGRLIADIPITVSLVLLASLVECFLILPHHMVQALASGARERWFDWPSRQVNRGFRWLRERAFRPLVRAVIALRYPVLAGALVLLAGQLALVVRGDVQWRFFNSPEQGSVSGNFAMLPGATRADTLEMLRELQRATDAVAARYEARHGAAPLAYVVGEVGGNTGRALAGSDTKEPDLLGAIAIELIDADLRPYSSFQFLADLQDEVRNHPLLEELSFRGWRSGPGGDALSVRLSGADAGQLKAAAEALKAALSAFPEVSALEDSLAYDKDELILELTARGQALGFTIDGIGRSLRERLNGIEAASFPEGPRSATIRVELPEAEFTADFMDRALMRAPSGAHVPLADIVTVERRAGFSSVRREDGIRVVSVTGDISEDDPDRAAAVNEALEQQILPRIEADFGVASQLSGLAEDEREFLSDATLGLMLCLLGIYLVLAWIFSSWGRPLVVMAVIPFGLVGAIWGHWVWEVPLSMFSVVGLIGMAGIIINDSIVLVTTVDDFARRRGLLAAIVDGAADRLRPVLLTTLTTVLGLAPLLYETSQQAQFLRPTVITLVYGLGFGMGLVLVVVPALMAAQRDVGRALTSARRVLTGGWRRRGLRLAGVAALALAGLFAVVVAPAIVPGLIPGPLPGLAQPEATLAQRVGAFVVASAGLLAGLYLLALLAAAWRRRRAG